MANFEEDPAAEFLADEENKLAELEENDSSQIEPVFGDHPDSTEKEDPLVPTEQLTNNIDHNFEHLNGESEPPDNQPADPYSAISSQDKIRQEPEKIKIWREEQIKLLAEKDAEAEKKCNEWRESAKKELDDWYRNREETLHKHKQSNREAEKAFIEERDECIPGQQWERVARLCEFNPKSSKSTKDTSRLRSILLQLKAAKSQPNSLPNGPDS